MRRVYVWLHRCDIAARYVSILLARDDIREFRSILLLLCCGQQIIGLLLQQLLFERCHTTWLVMMAALLLVVGNIGVRFAIRLRR